MYAILTQICYILSSSKISHEICVNDVGANLTYSLIPEALNMITQLFDIMLYSSHSKRHSNSSTLATSWSTLVIKMGVA